MGKKPRLDKFHYHEALDRASILANMVEVFLVEHPVIRRYSKLEDAAKEAQANLVKIHGLVGRHIGSQK